MTITNNLRFPGQYFDAETGLNYNLNRDYNAPLGTYVEADPIGINRGQNHLYLYAKNNSISYFDEKGLKVEICSRSVNVPWVPNWVQHMWVRTSTKSMGMGTMDCGDLVGSPYLAQTKLCDHSTETGSCQELKCVDETCVNNELILGKPLGRWGLTNNCATFAGYVTGKCFKANSPECCKNKK